MSRLATLCLILVAWSPAPAFAQLGLHPGARVRVTAYGVCGCGPSTVLRQTSDSLVLGFPDRTPIEVAIADLSSIEVSRGTSHLHGAYVGGVWGAAVGVLAFLASPIECDGQGRGADCLPDKSRPSQLQYLSEGAFGGAIIGAIIGGAIGRERWESVNIAGRPHIAASRHGASLGLSLPF